MKKNVLLMISVLASSLFFTACSHNAVSDQSQATEVFSAKRTVFKVTNKNSKQLRMEAAERAMQVTPRNLQERIKQRLYEAWGSWQPDYEGWLKWSDDLYLPNSTIMAIGDNEQLFHDYQASMKLQRDACVMEMGPIMQMTVENNTASLVYLMYLTPKGMNNAPTFSMMITEYNQFVEIDGKLMVSHLDLFTDGGEMVNLR